MKVGAILFMILGIFMILGTAGISFFGFVMSFDAPGSESDPGAWLNRILLFGLPLLVFIVLLVFAWIFFNRGQYVRSFWIGSVFGLVVAGLVAATVITSFASVSKMNSDARQTAEDERLYPLHTYLRPGEVAADTILVFPSRIVAYRIYTGEEYPFSGPVGDLNQARDTIVIRFDSDSKLKREDLSQFIDSDGKRLTDVYGLK
ncbi:MAG: hypothetical protein IPP15_16470 [Saprospiraceae bacterium]|uniref:Uncharacterized protein n=1 Tax=Candidatus Opimibacter skivensis TaxID=2982028 RepID=A0A9D7XNZ5_9BACT|nr:hypothetical protein [Candidatus Opimibacter skivensis]